MIPSFLYERLDDKTIFSNLVKGLSNSQGFDSDIDSTLFQDQ